MYLKKHMNTLIIMLLLSLFYIPILKLDKLLSESMDTVTGFVFFLLLSIIYFLIIYLYIYDFSMKRFDKFLKGRTSEEIYSIKEKKQDFKSDLVVNLICYELSLIMLSVVSVSISRGFDLGIFFTKIFFIVVGLGLSIPIFYILKTQLQAAVYTQSSLFILNFFEIYSIDFDKLEKIDIKYVKNYELRDKKSKYRWYKHTFLIEFHLKSADIVKLPNYFERSSINKMLEHIRKKAEVAVPNIKWSFLKKRFREDI